MRNYITDFMNEFEFDPRERVALAIAYERIVECAEAREIFYRVIAGYDKNTEYMSTELLTQIEAMAAGAKVNLYTAQLLIIISLSKKLRERLAVLKVSKKNIITTLSDFKIKMKECEMLHGVVGITNWEWYTRFFSLRLIGIGRLQFEVSEFKASGVYKKGERTVKRGTTVLSVHIPSSGVPLDDKLCMRAYKEARTFFTGLLGVEDIAFTCSSWLLYPKNREILPESANIVKFMNRYDLIEAHECGDGYNPAIAFVFMAGPNVPISALPRDTTLRRGYADHLEKGGKMGYGYGIFFLEDKK